MKALKVTLKLLLATLVLSLSQGALASCGTFDPGEDPATCLANCVNANCDSPKSRCSTYCDMQNYSSE